MNTTVFKKSIYSDPFDSNIWWKRWWLCIKEGWVLMTIDKKDLFERTRQLWPEEIDLEKFSTKDKTVTIGQILNDIYSQIEASFDQNDHWIQVAIWAYHQAIPRSQHEKTSKIFPRDVEFDRFDQMMKMNLNGDDCWVVERDQWKE